MSKTVRLTGDKRTMFNKIIGACIKHGIVDTAPIQYVIATALWESAFTLRPVKESYWVKNWKHYIKHSYPSKNYFPFFGRGLVQITHLENYKKFSGILGVNLVDNPDLALEEDNAIEILVLGMRDGVFTGKKLDDYMNNNKINFVEARYIVNGRDKRKEIAILASSIDIDKGHYVRY